MSEGDESRAGPLRLEKVWTSQPREWRKESKRGMESCRLEAERARLCLCTVKVKGDSTGICFSLSQILEDRSGAGKYPDSTKT